VQLRLPVIRLGDVPALLQLGLARDQLHLAPAVGMQAGSPEGPLLGLELLGDSDLLAVQWSADRADLLVLGGDPPLLGAEAEPSLALEPHPGELLRLLGDVVLLLAGQLPAPPGHGLFPVPAR